MKRVELVYVFIEEDHERVETTRRAPLVLCGEIPVGVEHPESITQRVRGTRG